MNDKEHSANLVGFQVYAGTLSDRVMTCSSRLVGYRVSLTNRQFCRMICETCLTALSMWQPNRNFFPLFYSPPQLS